MSNEVPDHQSIKEETVEIEIEPRVAVRAGYAPEANNDMAGLGLPKADTNTGNDKIGPISSQDPGSTAQSVQSSPSESCVLGRPGQDEESQSHTSQEVIDDNVHPVDLNDQILLSDIRDFVLCVLIPWLDSIWIRDTFGAKNGVIPEPFVWNDDYISDAWPTSRDVAGVEQCIIEKNGDTTKIQAHWPSRWYLPRHEVDTPYDTIEGVWLDWCRAARDQPQQEASGAVDNVYPGSRHSFKGKIIYCALNVFEEGAQVFPIPPLACAFSFEQPFLTSRVEVYNLNVGKSVSFLATWFRGGYGVETHHDLHNTIHWQIRYFSPISEGENGAMMCLFTKRQKATLQHGPGKTTLQEKRAVVSFRVLKKAPELFSILVVKDEGFADIKSLDEQFDVNRFWKGYGFLQSENTTPLTLYLLEICRVFKMCMGAWEETLRTIDRLILVQLEDLDNLTKVEELMFDNSFKRSKDYFVALQVLRIMDEWLDEVESTVEDMFKDSVLVPASMWPDGSAESFEVAVRYVNKQTTAIKSRVRKKQEEINSLRDGLFNATSLRESSKAMALNQAIYVFTVVTVLFTPVSFLATFWALPFLNNPTEGTDVIPVPAAFRNSFIIMPILTYALVIGVAWFVGQRNSVNALLTVSREFVQSTGQLLRSEWNLGRKKTKRHNERSPSP